MYQIGKNMRPTQACIPCSCGLRCWFRPSHSCSKSLPCLLAGSGANLHSCMPERVGNRAPKAGAALWSTFDPRPATGACTMHQFKRRRAPRNETQSSCCDEAAAPHARRIRSAW